MSLLLLLRSQVAASATIVRGGGYTVSVDYDQTSVAVMSLSWTNTGGPLTVSIKSGGQATFTQPSLTGAGSVAVPAGYFFDQTFEAYTAWATG